MKHRFTVEALSDYENIGRAHTCPRTGIRRTRIATSGSMRSCSPRRALSSRSTAPPWSSLRDAIIFRPDLVEHAVSAGEGTRYVWSVGGVYQALDAGAIVA